MKKLNYKDWVKKYFTDNDGWHYSNHELIVLGFAWSDLSHYKTPDLKEEYQHYLKGTADFPEAYEE